MLDRMKAILALLLFAAVCLRAGAEAVNFDEFRPGPLPPGWTATQTGKGQAKWEVVKADSAPSPPHALQQSGEADFPVCLKAGPRLKDGFVEVKFKPLAGKADQAGGVIWRARDADHYYVARANVLENNVTIYRTVAGKRVAFKTVDCKVVPGSWHTLRVEFAGNRFTVWFNGQKVLEATDDTFADAGRVGLWTKADSVTLFDDFRCEGR
jgi:hypothetical protein